MVNFPVPVAHLGQVSMLRLLGFILLYFKVNIDDPVAIFIVIFNHILLKSNSSHQFCFIVIHESILCSHFCVFV